MINSGSTGEVAGGAVAPSVSGVPSKKRSVYISADKRWVCYTTAAGYNPTTY